MSKKRISVSQIGTFTTCAKKWELSYKRGIRSQSGGVSPMALGDVVHFAIAAALRRVFTLQNLPGYLTYDVLKAEINDAVNLWDESNRASMEDAPVLDEEGIIVVAFEEPMVDRWQVMLNTASVLALRTLQNIRIIEDYNVVSINVDNEAVPLVEYMLVADIEDTEFEFAGIVDAVLYNRNTGLVEVFDWKVRHSFTELETEQINMQVGIYQYVLHALHNIYAPIGIVYQIKDTAPKYPKLNGDGTMSRQKITSDWRTYEEALLAAGLDPDDYIDDMLPKLSGIEFWRPLMVMRTSPVQEKLWINLVEHAQRIHNETLFPRSYGYPCRNCQFLDFCNAELYNYDVDALFDERYTYTEWADNKEYGDG